MRHISYAEVLLRGLGQNALGRHSLALLRGPAPTERDALLDSHSRLLKTHLDNINAALAALPEPASIALNDATPTDADTRSDEATDLVAYWLIQALESWPDEARALAVATARLVEDSGVLHPAARHQRPLGRGFESLFDERLRRRFSLLPEHAGHLTILRSHLQVLMEEPDQGLAEIELALGSALTAEEKAWLDVERRCAMLRFVRHRKTENGHIRWYLRRNAEGHIVLDRFGVRGHWIVCGAGSEAALARIGTAVERVTRPDHALVTSGWRLVCAEDQAVLTEADPLTLRARIRRNRSMVREAGPEALSRVFSRRPQQTEAANVAAFELRADDDGLALVALRAGADCQVAQVDHDAGTDELLEFLDRLDCVADLSLPRENFAALNQDSEAVEWARALLRHREVSEQAGRRVRLVYVPSAIPHQLGGVPLIGMDFLRDRLERMGARVNVLSLPPADFERRAAELLGADVIGIGVYIHNSGEVAELVKLLRALGYQGKIILGGPQLRDIDGIQASISGWDALIRGEAEDALPVVLQVLDELDAGRSAEGLRLARTLSGVAIRHGQAVLLCDTAERLKAETIACPLPFDWMRGKSERRLQMNFTRGCPYKCVFCPNHQGQLYRSGPADELWRFTALAVADDLDLPPEAELATAKLIQDHLGVAAVPRLRVALHLLLRAGCSPAKLADLLAPLTRLTEPQVGEASADNGQLSAWQVKKAWLAAKLALLSEGQLRRKPAFVLITSEDNTLVNRAVIREYLGKRLQFGLEEDVIFDPGQNTVWDLTDAYGHPDEEYIGDLVRSNPFAVALGVDGASNPVIRQNSKPRYTIGNALAVNRALARHGVVVANNYILLTPETDLLEAVEAFALFLLLPMPWRDYGHSVNLRVIKEEGTLAHDEGLIFAPDDTGWDEPLRFSEVADLLDRWSLTSRVASDELRPLLRKILTEDSAAAPLVPLVVERWERNYDADDELQAISQLIRAAARADVPLVETMRVVSRDLAANVAKPLIRPAVR
jgi:hypothetical protein